MWFLGFHGFTLDGAYGGHGGFLGRWGEGVDVRKNVGWAGEGEGRSVRWEEELVNGWGMGGDGGASYLICANI